jgi:hypothetical protein
VGRLNCYVVDGDFKRYVGWVILKKNGLSYKFYQV